MDAFLNQVLRFDVHVGSRRFLAVELVVQVVEGVLRLRTLQFSVCVLNAIY